MSLNTLNRKINLTNYLSNYTFIEDYNLFENILQRKTELEYLEVNNQKIPKFINEFWTSKQRQANSIHEISY